MNSLKYTFIILATTLGVALAIGLIIAIPYIMYKTLIDNKEYLKIGTLETREEDLKLYNKLRLQKILFWIAVPFIYVPFALPTLLFIISIL